MPNLFFTFLAILLIFDRAWAPPNLISKMLSKKSPDSGSSTPKNSKSSKSDCSVGAMKRLQKELKKLMENEDKIFKFSQL